MRVMPFVVYGWDGVAVLPWVQASAGEGAQAGGDGGRSAGLPWSARAGGVSGWGCIVKRLQDMTEPELSQFMTLAAELVGVAAKSCEVEPPMFALVVFNDPKVGQYIANCQRPDVIKALREVADRLQRKEDVPR